MRALPFLLSAVLVLTSVFYPAEEAEGESELRVVRVWNVDTFEGGKGSRTSFLKAAARRTEEARKGVYYLVVSYTLEGAEEAFRRGEAPDALSFGVGLSAFAERALPLRGKFAGGELGGETRALPWCAGGYALFSLDGFEGEGKTAISCGGENLAEIAAAVAGIAGDPLPSGTAYARFLAGEYRFLLGTQRDLCRFRARGVEAEVRPLSGFCDLFQYFSVLSAEKGEDCVALLDELLSPRTQEKLGEIGMYPPAGGELGRAERTVGVFCSRRALASLRAEPTSKNLEKFLKTV